MDTMTTQLKETINNTSEKTLSEKLSKYFLDESPKAETFADALLDKLSVLDELRDLIQEMQIVTGNYEFDALYDNNQEFWDNRFEDPYDAVEAVGADYNFGDDYSYINESTGSVESCSSLSEFYNSSVIKTVTKQIAADLKENTAEIIDNMEPYIQNLLLNISKKISK